MKSIAAPHSAGPDDLMGDSLGWDVATFGRALRFCVDHSGLQHGGDALEVGADGENGGVSLWLAAHGWRVTCTGLGDPPSTTVSLHRKHGVEPAVRYSRLDVLELEERQAYDLVVLKSVLGHVGQGERLDLQIRAIRNVHRALRPGGELWLIENSTGTRLHALARARAGAGRFGWRYLALTELEELLEPFDSFTHRSFGVAAAAGRRESQRTRLGRLDQTLLERVAPPSWRYVVAAVARAA